MPHYHRNRIRTLIAVVVVSACLSAYPAQSQTDEADRLQKLEKAVQVTLEAMKKNPVVLPDHPPYPSYHKK